MQEHLIFTDDETSSDFRIDERTKSVGRQGIAAARARLALLNSPVEIKQDFSHKAA